MTRRPVLIALAALAAGPAWAQNGGSEIYVPPAPAVVPEQPSPPAPVQAQPVPPPGLVQAMPPGENSAPSQPAAQPPAAAAGPPPPDVAPTPPDSWTSETTATLGVLNKVDGSTSKMVLKVGGPAQNSGDLSVSVQACLTRPPGQLPDVAVFLTVTPQQQQAVPLYRGWMLRSAPGATFVGNAGQTFRIISCS